MLSDDGFVEVPNEEGLFQNIDEFSQWSVEGASTPGRGSASSLAPSHQFAHQPPDPKGSGGKQKWRPAYSTTSARPVSSAHCRTGSNQPPGVIRQQQTADAKDKEWSKKIDICKLEGNSWKETNNIHITLTEIQLRSPILLMQLLSIYLMARLQLYLMQSTCGFWIQKAIEVCVCFVSYYRAICDQCMLLQKRNAEVPGIFLDSS